MSNYVTLCQYCAKLCRECAKNLQKIWLILIMGNCAHIVLYCANIVPNCAESVQKVSIFYSLARCIPILVQFWLIRRVHNLWETDFCGHWRVDFWYLKMKSSVRIFNTCNVTVNRRTSFFNEIEDIWDKIVHISKKGLWDESRNTGLHF